MKIQPVLFPQTGFSNAITPLESIRHTPDQQAPEATWLDFTQYRTLSRASCATDTGYNHGGHWGRAGAGLLILSPDRDQVALFMRSSEVDDAGLWGIPGGARGQMEDGSLEAPLITALSEAREELKCVPQGRLWTAPVRFVHPDRQFTYDTHVIVLYDKDIFTPRLNWEHTEFSWHAINDAKSNPQVHPGVRFSLDRLNGKSGSAGETDTTPWTTQPQAARSSSNQSRDQAVGAVAWCKRVMRPCLKPSPLLAKIYLLLEKS